MKLYSTREVAEVLSVSEATVKRWADAAMLNCFRTPGGHRKFTTEAILAFAKTMNFPPPPLERMLGVTAAVINDDHAARNAVAREVKLLEQGAPMEPDVRDKPPASPEANPPEDSGEVAAQWQQLQTGVLEAALREGRHLECVAIAQMVWDRSKLANNERDMPMLKLAAELQTRAHALGPQSPK